MWFKQANFYVLDTNNLPSQADLEQGLSEALFASCQGLDWFSEGFSNPVSFEEGLVFSSSSTMRVALLKEEKVLPSQVIKDLLGKKIAEIEKEEMRQVGRKEKVALKEQITDDLLPKAFTKQSRIQAIIDPNRGYFMVNIASMPKSEAMLSKLRQALGGLPATLPRTSTSPSALMTDWLLNGSASGNFELDTSVVMQGSGDTAPVIRASRQDLGAEEIKNLLLSGKTVSQLGLIWKDQIRFVLDSNMTLKSIQYLDMIQDEASQSGEDMPSLYAATQLIMTENLGDLFSELIEFLGGLSQD